MAEYVELYMDPGTDFEVVLELNDDNTNLPQNTDGMIVTSQMRKSLLSINATANLQCTIPDTTGGKLQLSLDAANTSNIKPGTYYFDVKIVHEGFPSKLIEGPIFVTFGITR